MADAPAERDTASQAYNRGREDTVVRPIPAPPEPNSQGDVNGTAKVLPPMPPKPVPTRKPVKAAKTPTPKAAPVRPGPKPAAPPAQVTKPVAAAAATAAVVTTAPVTAPAPAAPKVKAPRPEKAPKPVKPAKTPKPAKPAKAVKAAKEPAPKGRRARLRMTRIDPWSVMKTSFLLSIALGVVTVVSVFMVWSVLDAADVWTSINQTVQGVVGGQEASNFDIEDYIGTRRVVGFAMIVAAVDVVLLTAIATLGAFLYNMSASLLGGIEVTLAEDK